MLAVDWLINNAYQNLLLSGFNIRQQPIDMVGGRRLQVFLTKLIWVSVFT